jgi:hypothetical protein
MACRLMTTIVVTMASLLFTPVRLRAQEHAHSVESCRADLAVWGKKGDENDYREQEARQLHGGAKNDNPLTKVTVQELVLRMGEMGNCRIVDKSQEQQYLDVLKFYSSIISDRMRNFLQRHNLVEQFLKEDAFGER